VEPETRKLIEDMRSPFKPTRTWLLVLPFVGIADLANVAQRFPITHGLYGVETILMALNGLSAVVAFAALITKRSWQYTAFIAWMLLATVRLLGVGHLQ
jgi:hypothetical protein